MVKSKTLWTRQAAVQLQQIHNYIKYVKKSPLGAKNVKREIIEAANNITFSTQYQKDDINPKYRRIVIRQFKLLYTEDKGTIIILRIFYTGMDPKRLFENLE